MSWYERKYPPNITLKLRQENVPRQRPETVIPVSIAATGWETYGRYWGCGDECSEMRWRNRRGGADDKPIA